MEVSSKQIEDDRRSMISQCSRAVAEMPKSDLTEMKSFASPPAAVKDVLTATMILLGHSAAELDWKNIKKHMGKVGTDSLVKRIEDLDFENVPQETREIARNLLSKYTTAQIEKVSKAAKTLHEWAVAVADTD